LAFAQRSEKHMTIAVIGAGPAGLSMALMLARQGRRPVVFERFDQPGPVGAGFMLQPTGLHVLKTLGLTAGIERLGQPITRLFGREARRGRIVLDVHYGALDRSKPSQTSAALGVLRASLFDVLYEACIKEGVTFESSREVTAAQDGLLSGSSGQPLGTFDLIIDASGARSPIARTLPATGLFGGRRDLEWGALWCTVPWPAEDFDRQALEQVYQGAERMIGVLPSGHGRSDPSERATFFWSLKAADYPAWRAQGLEAWKDEARGLWPRVDRVLANIDDPETLTLARYGHHTLDYPVASRLAVIGDAAHSTSPQLGQGVNMALLDARALATALESGVDLHTALDAYARARRWHLRLYQALSLGFTPFYQDDGRLRPWIRDHVLGKLARLPLADQLLAATVSGLLLDPRD